MGLQILSLAIDVVIDSLQAFASMKEHMRRALKQLPRWYRLLLIVGLLLSALIVVFLPRYEVRSYSMREFGSGGIQFERVLFYPESPYLTVWYSVTYSGHAEFVCWSPRLLNRVLALPSCLPQPQNSETE